MSTTSKTVLKPETFYLTREGEGAIGFDGCRAIDFPNSDLILTVVESGPRIAERQEASLQLEREIHKITMRRAVKEFDFFYNYKFNTLIVAPDVASDYGSWIASSVGTLNSVVCHFGSRRRQYFFGNLKHANCQRNWIWQKSRFATAPSSDFDINQTLIGRGEVPLDHEVAYTAANQSFADLNEYYESKPSLYRRIPQRLAFTFGPCDIINLGVGVTLISTRLFAALWKRKRPKSRVLGMTGSHPLVKVEFFADSTP